MTHGMGNARKVLGEAGAKRTYAYGPVRNTGWHVMGTCRMGDDPGQFGRQCRRASHASKPVHRRLQRFPHWILRQSGEHHQAVALKTAHQIVEMGMDQ